MFFHQAITTQEGVTLNDTAQLDLAIVARGLLFTIIATSGNEIACRDIVLIYTDICFYVYKFAIIVGYNKC